MQGKYPGAILRVDMPADLVDVNVHPAKTEIRFARESDVFDAVYRTVRAALAAPGSGECRFDLGHVAKENPQPAPQQTTLPGSAPAQSNPQRPGGCTGPAAAAAKAFQHPFRGRVPRIE